MGIDCIVKVGDDYYSLDRWYVFSEQFKHGESVTVTTAKLKLSQLHTNLEDEDDSSTNYRCYWRGFVGGLCLPRMMTTPTMTTASSGAG